MAPLSKIVGIPLHGLTVHASTAFKQLVIAKVDRGVLAGFILNGRKTNLGSAMLFIKEALKNDNNLS